VEVSSLPASENLHKSGLSKGGDRTDGIGHWRSFANAALIVLVENNWWPVLFTV
jgi:hypothetical protein